MNLKFLAKKDLDAKIKTLAQAERELLHEVIMTIKEIDARRMYLDFGYASLYEYLVEEVKYLGGSAQRRIDAARLLKEVPEVGEKIKSGELTLGQITLVQKAVRQVERTQSKIVSSEEKLEMISNISNLSQAQSQQEVSLFLDLPVIHSTKKIIQADGSVRFEFTLSAEAYAKLQNAQELISHAVPTQDVAPFLEYVSDKIIKQKTSVQKSSGESQIQSSTPANSTATVAVKPLSLTTRKSILKQQECCQYRDPKTGRLCGSKWFLQVDHKHSKWAGGTDRSENLQMLCASHNQAKYRKEAGIGYVS